ncbi:NAD(P)/FAD-dependent oxidoreductase [Vaginella massiliensis]|uniref:NAD(P)/FAD-dependent oxidoreductase n=1 Tax=Vaginella massiliensis TaxID=1816680 RepID=UPI003751E62E
MNQEFVDVLIIGAGPAGSIAAAYLHQHQIQTKVVEKMRFPRLVIGESLLPRSMDRFEEAGLLDALNAYDFQVKSGARFIRGNQVCEFDFSKKFGEGWDWTWQVPRADFDKAITDELQKKGVDIAFETEVTHVAIREDGSDITVVDKTGVSSVIHAKYIIDASGYGRVLPRLLNLHDDSNLSPHSAIFSHTTETNRPAGREGTQITFDILETEVWLWVIPFSNGNTSIGIVGNTAYIEQLIQDAGSLDAALKQAINRSDFYRERFRGHEFLFEPKLLKNYSTSVKKMFGKGYVLTGNSTEFLDPVFSSGVCFATESGALAAELIIKEIQGKAVDWAVEYETYMKRGIYVFSTYVKEWYTGNLQELFFFQPENPQVKEKICAVLAGYVWNEENPFVKKHNKVIRNMAHLIKMSKA